MCGTKVSRAENANHRGIYVPRSGYTITAKIGRRLIRHFIVCCILSALCSLTNAADPHANSTAKKTRPPNVIVILADDLGYGDLGCYGQKEIQTPQLDKLAAEGVRFTQFYSGSTVCGPSRCSLLTGLHCGHAAIRGNAANLNLPADSVTIAELLRPAGYQCTAIGKWGLASPKGTGLPTKQGFQTWFGFMTHGDAHNYYPAHLWRNDQQVALDNVVAKGVAGKKVTYAPDLFTQDILRFVSERHAEPFFVYYCPTQPHANNEAHAQGMEVPQLGPYAEKQWPAPEKGRAAMISYLDRDIGKLMAKLRELELDEQTLVFFTSDNGPHKEGGSSPEFFHSSGKLRGIKRDLYEGGIRVPLIARWPGRIAAGKTTAQVGAFWDLMPTIAAAAGVEPPAGIDGVSLLPTLLASQQSANAQAAATEPNGAQQQHDFLYWEFHERGFQQAARHGPWKAIRPQAEEPLELFKLDNDPSETNNVAKEHPEIVAKFEAYFATARTADPNWPIKPPPQQPPARKEGK